jgi:putative zinc finger/helix-turn-helix YgiT family protein
MPEMKESSEEVRARPFPWRCPECGQKEVRPAELHHTSEIRHEGRLHTVELPRLRVPRCAACGEVVFDNEADRQIAEALRSQLGLLSADQIRTDRVHLGLSLDDLAQHLGVPIETISRWETGALTQSRAMDRYLRLYFGLPAVRAALVSPTVLPAPGMDVRG